MPYAYPTNITNMTGAFVWANSVTSYWFAPVIMIIVWIVAFLSLKIYSTARALASASFLMMLVAIFFRVIGLIGNLVVIGAGVITAVSIIWLWFEGKQDY
jgi:hypothetical protein